MKKTLRDKMRDIAREYAEKVGEILQCTPEYWVAEDCCIDVCAFWDAYFLDLGQMQVIVDHLPDWVERYGSEEQVGEVIREWMDWAAEDLWDADHGDWHSTPRINLWNWLKGLRPKDLKWTEEDEMHKLTTHLRVLKAVHGEYPTLSVRNVIQQLESREKELIKQREARRLRELEQMPEFNDYMARINR